MIFLLCLHCVTFYTAGDRKQEADIQHTVYWFEERGNKITLRDWCLCLYMTFTALHFISHSASLSPFCLLLSLPSIIPCRSERERRGGRKKKISLRLQTRCPGTGSQRGEGCFTVTLKGKQSRSECVKPWWHLCIYTSQLQPVSQQQRKKDSAVSTLLT